MRKLRAFMWNCGSEVGPVPAAIKSGRGQSWSPNVGPPLDAVSSMALALKKPYSFRFAPLPRWRSGIIPVCVGASMGRTRKGATAEIPAGPCETGGVPVGVEGGCIELCCTAFTRRGPELVVVTDAEAFMVTGAVVVAPAVALYSC